VETPTIREADSKLLLCVETPTIGEAILNFDFALKPPLLGEVSAIADGGVLASTITLAKPKYHVAKGNISTGLPQVS
jgi:hypothetical protein